MDNPGPVSTSTHKSSQRKFFQWAVKWFYTDQTENITMKPDLPELLCLLQAIGFQLREFEKHEDTISESRSKSDSLKVIMECSSSKMRAVMELADITCQCPNQDDAQDASFWSVSGSGPLGSMENMNKVMETGSNLLPSVSKDVTNVVRDVTQYLFKLLKNVPDVNQNTDLNLNLSALESSVKSSCNTKVALLGRRHTQPDFNTGRCRSLDALIKKNENLSDTPSAALPLPLMDALVLRDRPTTASLREPQQQTWNKQCPQFKTENNDRISSSPVASAAFLPVLRRQKTFDMDIETSMVEGEPRPSPPKISSSPVPMPQLCMSLGQISLQSDGKEISLIEMLLNSKNNLELALQMLINSPSASIVTLDDGCVRPARLENFSSKSSPGNISRPESSCSLPINPVTKNSNLQRSVRRNVASSFQKNSDGLRLLGNNKSMPTNRSLPQRKSTASRLTLSKPQPPKIDSTRPRSSGISLGSSTSRTIITARRRVSPDPKNSSSLIQKPNSSPNTSTSKSSQQTFSKLQPNVASPAKILPAATANKFGFVKKKH